MHFNLVPALLLSALPLMTAAPFEPRQSDDVPNISEIVAKANVTSEDGTVTIAALGNSVVVNNCGAPMYLWAVDYDHPSPSRIKIASGGRHSAVFRKPSNGGGVSLKVSKTQTLSQITQFEYTVSGNQIYYDISWVDCANGQNADNCPGHGGGVRAKCSDNNVCVYEAKGYVDEEED
jgi:hypothetical protein